MADVKPSASSRDYWVEISQEGKRLGAGFLLTRCYVLTALHCLRDVTLGNDKVDISFSAGVTLSGRIYRRSAAADLALIDIPELGDLPALPNPDRACVGETWRNPYRPSEKHALLTGNVAAVPVAYQCEGGDTIEAIQLGCSEPLGDYIGYSGSPIERNGHDGDRALLGILIEQYPEQYSDYRVRARASTVLFAATIAEVFRRFDCFDVSNLFKILAPPSREELKESSLNNVPVKERTGTAARSPDPIHQVDRSIESSIGAAGSLLEALLEWETSGLLEGLDVSTLRSDVVRNLISDIMEGGA